MRCCWWHWLSSELDPQILIYGTGLGLAPLEGVDLVLARMSFPAFDHLSVRDDKSADIAGVDCGFDDAFLEVANTKFDWLERDLSARAFVCLQQDVVGRNTQAVDAAVSSLLLSGVKKKEPVFLVEAIPPEDSWSLDLFKEQWDGDVWLLPFSHLWNRGFPGIDNAVWISSRFHMPTGRMRWSQRNCYGLRKRILRHQAWVVDEARHGLV